MPVTAHCRECYQQEVNMSQIISIKYNSVTSRRSGQINLQITRRMFMLQIEIVPILHAQHFPLNRETSTRNVISFVKSSLIIKKNARRSHYYTASSRNDCLMFKICNSIKFPLQSLVTITIPQSSQHDLWSIIKSVSCWQMNRY